jgi:2-C-methyl-D-erythritol 2,4-cyclodiphosphate synthase
MSLRVGIGYDSHRFEAGRPLILGGVEIPHERGLGGHSDADVVTHAIIDALLGATGAGDIGEHFPPSDERWRDADSIVLLEEVLAGLGGAAVNVDVTIVCEEPKLGPHKRAIAARIGAVIGVPVSVKATTNEGMGAVGRGEGIAVTAVALVDAD